MHTFTVAFRLQRGQTAGMQRMSEQHCKGPVQPKQLTELEHTPGIGAKGGSVDGLLHDSSPASTVPPVTTCVHGMQSTPEAPHCD